MLPIKTNNIRVTSDYGNRQYYYQGKLVKDFHTGIDIVGGEEIVAVADGVVTACQKTGVQYGTACFVRIKHDNGLYTLYYHMKSNSICVSVGDKVKKGQKIGIIGATGHATGVHLHFQIDKGNNSTSINPYDYIFGGKEVVTENKTSEEYPSGVNYKTTGNMYVRVNAGTIYSIKLVKQLTKDGQKNATSTNPNAYAVYKKGTIYTAQKVIKNNYGTWAQTPSGYVCMVGASGTKYCERV